MASNWARFWAVDLHVHTPASGDARDEDFGTAEDIVQKALDAGLDAIAVTDHNTAAWCAQMADAAEGTNLIVLPGFELSTPQGHLLGIWEQGTAPSVIEDVLIRVGIERTRLGDLDVVAAKMITECAGEIRAKGGVAIAAHIDKERGILTQPVQVHVNQVLADPSISAFEFVGAGIPTRVAAKLSGTRLPALLQGSDAYDAALSRHSATGIGVRRTWIKAARPDLCGLRYALEDPDLRVTLSDPAVATPHPTIDSVSISGGFLSGTSLGFSPDLNCLLGGTGAGKSLVLEALRFVLNQQVDKVLFATIRDEVDRRLESALCEGTDVAVEISTSAGRYRVKRTYRSAGSQPVVEQDVDGEWVQVGHAASSLLAVAASRERPNPECTAGQALRFGRTSRPSHDGATGRAGGGLMSPAAEELRSWLPRFRTSAVVRVSCRTSTWTNSTALNWVIPVPTRRCLPPNCAGQGYESAPKAATACSTWKRSRCALTGPRAQGARRVAGGPLRPHGASGGRCGTSRRSTALECWLNCCRLDWDVHFAFTPESHDCVIGTCPNGHRHLLG
jgi:hypothetical protein